MKLTKEIAKKYTARYYTALKKYEHHQARNEGTTETAFKDMLHNIALDLDLTLVKTTEKKKRNNIIPDGIIKDDYFRTVGYWEAKDSADDLDKEIYKKLKLGYPRSNIIFEDTSDAVLYQDNIEFKRYKLKREDELIEMLIQFFNYKEPVYEHFREAVEKFKQNISRLAQDFEKIIHKAKKADPSFKTAIGEFLEVCESSFHRDISEADVEDMLIQHLLTERIFRKVFDNPEFSTNNVIAVQLEKLVNILTKHAFNRSKFFESTNQYYQAIEEEASQFDDFTEKQGFLNRIYEDFFKSYSKKNADKNGIVYTPQSIVKFMVKFTNSLLEQEFGKNLSSKGVNIIDPCTGTGNFVMEVLRNIEPSQLPFKYQNEIFANELMLLPYYVASANIEHYYFETTKKYVPFENIVFTDTLELIEDHRKTAQQQKFDFFFNEANSERAKRQLESDLFVIIGNPPYNASQESENQNNKNTKNEIVDARVSETYASLSNAQLKNKLYDPYVKFFRWATDRLNKNNGTVCFISNNSFLVDIQFDGMRNLLLKDFDRVYHLDLGGDVYANPKLSGSKHNVFGIKVGVGITFLVRNQKYKDKKILYFAMDEYLTRYEKEALIADYIEDYNNLEELPWVEGYLTKTNNYFFDEALIEEAKVYEQFIELYNEEEKGEHHIFKNKFPGISTNRNEWVFAFTESELLSKMKSTIKVFNEEIERLQAYVTNKRIDLRKFNIDSFVLSDEDETRIKWSDGLKRKLKAMVKETFHKELVETSMFRPFIRKFFYHSRTFVDRPSFFNVLSKVPNTYLLFSGLGAKKVSPFITTENPNLDLLEKTQVFPLWTMIEKIRNNEVTYVKESNITGWALDMFKKRCKNEEIKEADVFYYVYAILHHTGFLKANESFLKNSSPRVPIVAKHFDKISALGKELAKLHIQFEKEKPVSLKPTEETAEYLAKKKKVNYSFENLRISRDKQVLYYNEELSFYIPTQAWGYEVNGRTPLEWIVDQYKNFNPDGDEILILIGKAIAVTKESTKIIGEISSIKY